MSANILERQHVRCLADTERRHPQVVAGVERIGAGHELPVVVLAVSVPVGIGAVFAVAILVHQRSYVGQVVLGNADLLFAGVGELHGFCIADRAVGHGRSAENRRKLFRCGRAHALPAAHDADRRIAHRRRRCRRARRNRHFKAEVHAFAVGIRDRRDREDVAVRRDGLDGHLVLGSHCPVVVPVQSAGVNVGAYGEAHRLHRRRRQHSRQRQHRLHCFLHRLILLA